MPTLTLPRSAVREINDEIVIIDIPEDTSQVFYGQLKSFQSARGILKGKKKQIFEYLEQTRIEWDRQR